MLSMTIQSYGSHESCLFASPGAYLLIASLLRAFCTELSLEFIKSLLNHITNPFLAEIETDAPRTPNVKRPTSTVFAGTYNVHKFDAEMCNLSPRASVGDLAPERVVSEAVF